MNAITRRALRPATLSLLLIIVGGCGPALQPVRGKVAYPDGKPVTEGMVVFESDATQYAITARGEIRTDGSYVLGTYKPGDGVQPGKYRVLVAPKVDLNDADNKKPKRPSIDPKYSDFKSSGLEFEVKSGVNEFAIQVTR